MNCTWIDCISPATHPQLDKRGAVWANLCGVHANALDGAVRDPDVRKMLSAWVKAKGGAKAAAEAM